MKRGYTKIKRYYTEMKGQLDILNPSGNVSFMCVNIVRTDD